MDFITILARAGVGALAGFTYGFTGYAKSAGEEMDWLKFAKTGILGAIVGVGSEFSGLSMDTVEIYAVSMGFTAVIENALKAVWRKIFGAPKK